MSGSRPETIQTFLLNGNPQGIRAARITSRTVQATEIPWKKLGEAEKRKEARGVGVYVLFGMSCLGPRRRAPGSRPPTLERGKTASSGSTSTSSEKTSGPRRSRLCPERIASRRPTPSAWSKTVTRWPRAPSASPCKTTRCLRSRTSRSRC